MKQQTLSIKIILYKEIRFLFDKEIIFYRIFTKKNDRQNVAIDLHTLEESETNKFRLFLWLVR